VLPTATTSFRAGTINQENRNEKEEYNAKAQETEHPKSIWGKEAQDAETAQDPEGE
jgi:hypothetical protein